MSSQDPDLIFSLTDGAVWVSWSDGRPSMKLGNHELVIAMMSDYIKQSELADRLLSDMPNSKPSERSRI